MDCADSRRSGGFLIYIKNNIKTRIVLKSSSPNVDYLILDLNLDNVKIFLASIFLPYLTQTEIITNVYSAHFIDKFYTVGADA